MDQPIDMASFALQYRELSARRSDLKREFERLDGELLAQMDALSLPIKHRMVQDNANSINTDHGTVMLTTKHRWWASDWDTMYRWLHERNAYHLLEKRISQSNMTEYLAQNPGDAPPGLNSQTEMTLSVRAPK